MNEPDLRGKTALVTGASSGFGRDFARELAARGMNLVLVARREDRLRAVADELTARFGVSVRVLAADLNDPAAPGALVDTLAREGVEVHVLVNNAGLGRFGPFADMDWARDDEMLAVNVRALTHLTKLLLPGMQARREGFVLLVASVASFVPAPLYATYAATKAYVLSLGEALARELAPSGVRVTTVCPGASPTEFMAVAGQRITLGQRLSVLGSDAIVRAAVRGLLRGRVIVVPGLLSRLTAWFVQLLPRRLVTLLAYRTVKGG